MDKRNLKHSEGFFIRVDEEFKDALEGLRRSEPSIPSKADVVRRLVLEAWAHKQPKKRK